MSFKLTDDYRGVHISGEESGILLYLNDAPPRNEISARCLVDVLNAAEAVAKEGALWWDIPKLRRALAAFKKEGA